MAHEPDPQENVIDGCQIGLAVTDITQTKRTNGRKENTMAKKKNETKKQMKVRDLTAKKDPKGGALPHRAGASPSSPSIRQTIPPS
jgi:hypothetical protein